jgi:hypothetical protein
VKLPINYHDVHFSIRKLAREEYIKQQDGKCYYCGAALSGDPSDDATSLSVDENLFPESFFNWPVHLHHNHDTGMTIGAVHCHCNAVLWQYHGE